MALNGYSKKRTLDQTLRVREFKRRLAEKLKEPEKDIISSDKILLVDDDSVFNYWVTHGLQSRGIDLEIIECLNGNKAVELYEEHNPKITILDQMLPGRSGFLVLEKIKPLRKRMDQAYVIMVTANPGERHKRYAEEMGVDVYLNKPFCIEKLASHVYDFMRK